MVAKKKPAATVEHAIVGKLKEVVVNETNAVVKVSYATPSGASTVAVEWKVPVKFAREAAALVGRSVIFMFAIREEEEDEKAVK